MTRSAGQALIVGSIVNFFAVETLWFARYRAIGPVRAFASVTVGMIEGTALMLLIGFLFTR